MRFHPIIVAVGFALLATSCGVSRDADVADPPTTAEAAEETVEEESTPSEDAVTTTAAPAPTTTAPAGDVAVSLAFADGDTVEVLHGELNDVVVPTRENQEFVDLVYQGEVPAGFTAVVLSQNILGQAIDHELAAVDTVASAADEAEALDLLFQQLTTLLPGAADPAAEAQRLYEEVPYLQFIVGLQARQISLSNYLAANAPEGAGNPCVRHILVETEAEGDTIQNELAAGADFSELAIERSTGPSGPTGGALGCAPAANYVPEFATAVQDAEVGVFVGPIETQFGWHVLIVDEFEVDGDALAQQTLTGSLQSAEVSVDERLGTWDVTRLTVIPVTS